MISKEYEKYTLVCDICGVETVDEFDSFQDTVDAKKDMGWKSKRIDSEWMDLCPDCIDAD